MDVMIEYILKKYKPLGIIVYGSFADGSNNENSDFDALVIADGFERKHDNSVIAGIELDVFVYPMATFTDKTDWENFCQIYDGQVIFDTDGIAASIANAVKNHVNSKPKKTQSENLTNLEWCKKMLLRTTRKDAEGYYRWHWLLVDSLEIYFDLTGQLYLGPKKSIRKLQNTDETGFALYEKALRTFEYDSLLRWIDYLYGKKT